MSKINYEIIKLSNFVSPFFSIAIGNFNGLHLGHMSLIKEVYKIAENTNSNSAILTFNHTDNYQLLDDFDKKNILRNEHISAIISVSFDEYFKSLSKEDFISFLLSLNVKNIVVGEDFRFAKNRTGNVLDLISSPIHTKVLSLKTIKKQKISSSNIIACLQNGNIESANEMLNYPYHINGVVQHGLRNGHKIGFPTANISFENYVIPKIGVYAAKIIVANQSYYGMAYIGTHSTIDELKKPILEVNIFDFNADIYQKNIRVELHKYLTNSFTFNSLDELKFALTKYKNETLNFFSKL